MLLVVRVCILGGDPAIKELEKEAEGYGDLFKAVVLHEVPSDQEEPYRLYLTVFDGDTIDGWADSLDRLLSEYGAKIFALKHSSADVAFSCRRNPEGSEPYVWINGDVVRRLADLGAGIAFEMNA